MLTFGLFGSAWIVLSLRANPGLVVDDTGFDDRSSAVAVGRVPWSDVTSVSASCRFHRRGRTGCSSLRSITMQSRHGGWRSGCPTLASVKTWVIWIALLLVAPLLFGCSGRPSDGDCSGRVRYQGTLYRSHNELNQAAPLARPLGGGDIVGCGDLGADAVDRVEVRAVGGVDPGIAVAIGDKKWRGVYVAVGVQKASWPEVLRHR